MVKVYYRLIMKDGYEIPSHFTDANKAIEVAGKSAHAYFVRQTTVLDDGTKHKLIVWQRAPQSTERRNHA
jgi:hypothetical protein